MQNAAVCGLIVVLNISDYRCDAFIVERHQISSRMLADLKNEDMIERCREYSPTSPAVLQWLWDAVASPVLDALGITETTFNDSSWPDIW